MPVPDYFNRVNRHILQCIPPDAKVVLEIGCGAGALAEAYRRINPGVEWFGFEINREAAAIASQQMTHCFVKDIESTIADRLKSKEKETELFSRMEEKGYELISPDCIILGDILEHLRDPWEALKWCHEIAEPGAQILASIPNIQHFATVFNLLNGHWRYAEHGTLDRTHLRFFTLEGIRELFEQAGLQIYEIRGIRADDDEKDWETWTEFSKSLNIDQRLFLPLQYVVRAIKPALEITNLHIHAVVHRCPENGTCCERARIDEPLAALATIPGVVIGKATFDAVNPNYKADIIIQQRHQLSLLDLSFQRYAIQEGSLLIAEWDDDPRTFPRQIASNFIALKSVHAVQVSTEKLAEVVRQWNPNVAVFENQLAELPPWKDKPNATGLSIFFGCQNRQSDWRPIISALNTILDYHPRICVKVIHDREFFCALETPNKEFHTFLPYDKYLEVLRSCNIALLPLEPTPFNQCKSDLKFLECAANGVVVLASSTVYESTIPYSGRINDYRGIIYRSHREFEGCLHKLINSPELRRVLTRNAYSYVRDHRLLGQHYRRRYEWYRHLLSSKPELDRQLKERVPELCNETSYRAAVE